MKSQKSFSNQTNTLYLVSTPIGNLQDFSFRAIDILKSVDVIYAEDTRCSLVLLNHYQIHAKLKSYHEYNEEEKTKSLLEDLKSKDVAIISDAGTPLISDPGYEAVQACIDKGYNVVSIPGACAFLSALLVSGLPVKPFLFYGFLSEKSSKRKKELEDLKKHSATLIFYESPHRINDTLKDLEEILGNRKIAISRELTKKFEEIIRGNISDFNSQKIDLKGEIVIVVEGNSEKPDFSHLSIETHVNLYIKEGYSKNEAIKLVAKDRGMIKQEIYKIYTKKEEL